MNLKSISHQLAGDVCAIALLTLPLSLTLIAADNSKNIVFETSNRISVSVATQQYLNLIDGRVSSVSTDSLFYFTPSRSPFSNPLSRCL